MNPAWKKRLRLIAIWILALTALLSAVGLIAYQLESSRAEQRFDALSRQIHAGREASGVERPLESALPAETPPPLSPLEAVAALQAENGDLAGWLTVPGTNIDYPVMHTPNAPQYYLRKDFDKNYSLSGTPFLDGRCTLTSGNLILWGHNMKSGTMFADLLCYREADYAAAHSQILFTTPEAAQVYEVVAAFPTEVNRDGVYFRWYDYLDFPDEGTFDAFIRGLREKSLLPVPGDLAYGDTFLTMATCSYHDENGRFVVVGRRLP